MRQWKFGTKHSALFLSGCLAILFGAAVVLATFRPQVFRQIVARLQVDDSKDNSRTASSTDADNGMRQPISTESPVELAAGAGTNYALPSPERSGAVAGDLPSASVEEMRRALRKAQQQLSEQGRELVELRRERLRLMQEQAELQDQMAAAQRRSQQEVSEIRSELRARDSTLQTTQERIATLEQQRSPPVENNPRVNSTGGLPDIEGDPRALASKNTLKRVDPGNYYALVIGNSNYRNIKELETPANDARVLAELLKERYDFRVRVLLDATSQDITSALQDYMLSLREADNFLVYYAGHGVTKGTPSRAYWLGVDAETNKQSGWLATNEIRAKLKQMDARHVLVLADASFAEGKSIAPVFSRRVTEQRFMLQSARRARMVLASGRDTPVVDVSSNRKHSVFAKSLIQVLRQNENLLSGEMLSNQLMERMKTNPSSRIERKAAPPVYLALSDANHEFGDFFFVPGPLRLAGLP